MYIGIDLGTSAIKLALVDIDNHQLIKIKDVEKEQSVQAPYPHWSEQDPNVWYDLMIQGLKTLTKDHKRILGISFSGQMHGLVLLDKDDQVLRPAILWNDQRTKKQTDQLIEDLGEDTIFEETNNIMLTGFTAPKILWVKENEPDIFKRIDKIMLPKDYLIYRLSKEHISDVTDMSGSLFYRVKDNQYSKKILNYLGISIEQLPKVLQSTDSVGPMIDSIKESLDLEISPMIYPGGGDQAVGACLTSTFNEGDCSISVGTSGVVFTPIDKIDSIKENTLHCFRHVNNRFFLMGVTLSAAASIQWYKEQFLNHLTYDQLYDAIETYDQNDLIFLPYLNGERTPINNPNARGVLMNLSSQTVQEEVFKAVLEGVAFSLRNILDEMKRDGISIKEAAVIGGGTRNPKFTQILADVLQIKLFTVNQQMGPALGAAMVAMVGNGAFNRIEDIRDKQDLTKDMIYPNQSLKDYYDKKYSDYNQLYKRLVDFF